MERDARIFIAAGSNVDPERNLVLAARRLAQSFPGARFSGCYLNAAVGFDGPDFINFVAEIHSSRAPRGVLEMLHRIEAECGRERDAPKWAPRSMDLDLLLFGQCIAVDSDLVLPRPDLLTKAYMLGPMAELAPDVVHPLAGKTIGDLWQAFDRSSHPMRRMALELAPAVGSAP